MSDLRDRIAAAILNALGKPFVDSAESLIVADAVIAELQIEAEDGECNYCHTMLPGCRYSTWKADDE